MSLMTFLGIMGNIYEKLPRGDLFCGKFTAKMAGEKCHDCFFKDCKVTGKNTQKTGEGVIRKLIEASELRNDGLKSKLEEKLEEKYLWAHKDCKTRYRMNAGRTRKKSEGDDIPVLIKRPKRNSEAFPYERDCFICAEECLQLDPKHPDR